MADRRTFKQTEDGEAEIAFEDLQAGDVFRLEDPDGKRIEGTWRASGVPWRTETPNGAGTWGVMVEPA